MSETNAQHLMTKNAWYAFLNSKPIFEDERFMHIGDWKPGETEVSLEGRFSFEQLILMGNYMREHVNDKP